MRCCAQCSLAGCVDHEKHAFRHFEPLLVAVATAILNNRRRYSLLQNMYHTSTKNDTEVYSKDYSTSSASASDLSVFSLTPTSIASSRWSVTSGIPLSLFSKLQRSRLRSTCTITHMRCHVSACCVDYVVSQYNQFLTTS
jgi:hypothetical protein